MRFLLLILFSATQIFPGLADDFEAFDKFEEDVISALDQLSLELHSFEANFLNRLTEEKSTAQNAGNVDLANAIDDFHLYFLYYRNQGRFNPPLVETLRSEFLQGRSEIHRKRRPTINAVFKTWEARLKSEEAGVKNNQTEVNRLKQLRKNLLTFSKNLTRVVEQGYSLVNTHDYVSGTPVNIEVTSSRNGKRFLDATNTHVQLHHSTGYWYTGTRWRTKLYPGGYTGLESLSHGKSKNRWLNSKKPEGYIDNADDPSTRWRIYSHPDGFHLIRTAQPQNGQFMFLTNVDPEQKKVGLAPLPDSKIEGFQRWRIKPVKKLIDNRKYLLTGQWTTKEYSGLQMNIPINPTDLQLKGADLPLEICIGLPERNNPENTDPRLRKFLLAPSAVKFDQPEQGRYFRFVIKSGLFNRPFAAIAELELLDSRGTPLNRSGWKIRASSSDEETPPAMMIDANPETWWSSQYGQPRTESMPHYIEIDFGSAVSIAGFRYISRPTSKHGFHGLIRDYQCFVSDTYTEWGTPVSEGRLRHIPAGAMRLDLLKDGQAVTPAPKNLGVVDYHRWNKKGAGFRFELGDSFDSECRYDLRIELPYETEGEVWTKRPGGERDLTAFAAQGELQGHLYRYFSASGLTWYDADKLCREMGGQLISTNTAEEIQLVTRLSGGYASWLGITDREQEGQWKWANGKPVTKTFWNQNEPNVKSEEDYAILENGGWADTREDHQKPRGFVCEWTDADIITKLKQESQSTEKRSVVLRIRDDHGESFPICRVGDRIIADTELEGGRDHLYNFWLTPGTPVTLELNPKNNHRLGFILYEAETKRVLSYSKPGVQVRAKEFSLDYTPAVLVANDVDKFTNHIEHLKTRSGLAVPADYGPIWYRYRNVPVCIFKIL